MPNAQLIPGLSGQAVVQIEIAHGRIHVYPQRAADTVIYNCDPKAPAPALPREVRWVVTGLEPGQYVRIEPKDHASEGMFEPPGAFVVDAGFNTIASGCPRAHSGSGHHLVWNYAVVLCGPGGEIARKDPGIVIKDYP